ncbi:MAG: prepilin-type N-terminal cleavage/methylation domain-containing protein [Planctomycetota bacterium]|nr:prepilin-type N-terminal cleavage/methylation domain-containing protein [Planctomycetota bacterium]
MKTAFKQSGFSLVELMMSLGILVVGLAMVATAFPTAMMETKFSVEDSMATMISENAAAICRVRLSHITIKDSVSGQVADVSSLISRAERAYPVVRGDHTSVPKEWVEIPSGSGDYYPLSLYGWLLAARQPSSNDVNDYQLVIVPYRKFLPGDKPPSFSNPATVNVDGTGEKLTDGSVVSIGSPVISTFDGTFAYVVDSAGNLSCRMTPGAALAVGDHGQNSPAIGCYVVRTAAAP